MNQPWECPRCGKINAPFNPTCFCKKKEKEEKIETSVYQSIPNETWNCSKCYGYHHKNMGCLPPSVLLSLKT